MLNTTAYALAKKYTEETCDQFGYLKGAPCKIKSIVKLNDQNIVTFEWKNDAGETRESVMYVNDGTPIYTWKAGDHYEYGDLAIYQSCLYRCITPNDDIVFDNTKWNEIGSPDGNYDIVQNSSLLPSRFTPADRKMYYSIEDECFWLWDGTQWAIKKNLMQYEVMPIPSLQYVNNIIQYIGTDQSRYTTGFFYKCNYVNDNFIWEPVDTQDIRNLTSEQVQDLINRI